MEVYPGITMDPGVRFGKPCIKGTRIDVATVLGRFAAGDKVDDGEVWLGAQPKVPLSVGKDFVVTLPRKVRKDMKVSVEYDRPISAPIQKGDTVGKVVMTAPDVTPVEAPLVAAASVERMNPWGRIATLAGYLVWGQRR